MLSNRAGSMKCEYFEDCCIFDLETTGLSTLNDAVIEISAIKVRGGKAVEEFSMLVDPGVPIPYQASYVNGITDAMVAGKPNFEEALEKFLEFVGDDVLVGHNIYSFDLRFLQRDAFTYWGKAIGNDYVDTLRMARRYLPLERRHGLGNLACHYGIPVVNAHRALGDCRMNLQIYQKLGEEMHSKG